MSEARARDIRQDVVLYGGLTLIVVLAVLALLVPVLWPSFLGDPRSRVRSDLVLLSQSLDAYAIRNKGLYPDTLEVLAVRDVNGKTYLNRTQVPRDPWGRAYGYDPPSRANPRPRVYCLGADGAPGGSGEDRDLDNLMIQAGK